MKKEIKSVCMDCGTEIDDDDDVCQDCYEDNTFMCCLCGNDGRVDDQHNMVVVFDPESAGVKELQLGIYLVTSKPYYICGLIGSSWLYEWAIKYLAKIPEGADSDDYPCGHLCLDCQKKISQIDS